MDDAPTKRALDGELIHFESTQIDRAEWDGRSARGERIQ